ncbi:MAG: preprotein translocase subunit SecG [Nitrobacter sp.]|jgi:preprotein translocase subunit SecG|uniref:preprotein translocase subunit SecG n=1 Tax=Nitrobacter sp. 62-13 TaxID=1895797 RepID=UPI000961D350|nr:preprotein translocase subunit SecG [Nitrobacter sp. 62-13]OJU28054.1 MAG: preprotein translocase subunit SecG [Nitrobacter sp. 62-13]
MQTVVIVLHLMIVSALTVVVLLQKSEGGGLGMGGGAGFMSSRGTANLLTRTTAFLAAGFFLTSLFLSWLAGYEHKPGSILDAAPASQSQPAGGATPVAPPASGGLLDSLKQSEKPAAPAPAGPQAPRSQ